MADADPPEGSQTAKKPRRHNRDRLPTGMAWLIPMALAAIAVVYAGSIGDQGGELGPQAFTRLARLGRMLQDSWWLAGYEPREFPPFGHMLYWTLPIDALLLVLSLPLGFIVGWSNAMPYAVGLMAPASYLMMMAALIWSVRPLGEAVARRRKGHGSLVQLMAGLLALSIPATLPLAQAGKADGTLLMATMWLLVIGSFLRIGSGQWKDRGAVTSGFFSGMLVWMSVSTIPPLVVVWLAFGLHASSRGGNALRQAMISVSTMALTLMVGSIADPGLDPWAIHRISLTYVLAGIMAICVFAAPIFVLRRHPDWTAGGVGAFMVVAVALGSFYLLGWTGLLLANETIGGGYARGLLWDRIGSLQPADALPLTIAFLGHAIVGIMAASALALRGRPGGNGGTRLFWMLAVGVLAILMFMGAIHIPLGLYAELAGVMALSVALSVIWRLFRREVRRPFALPAFGVVVLLSVMAVPFGAARLAGDEPIITTISTSHPTCRIKDVAAQIQAVADRTGNRHILSQPNYGPEILHRTRLSIVSGPWISNTPGLDVTYKVLTGQDDDEAAALLRRFGVGLILICPAAPGPAILRADPDQTALFARLTQLKGPDWAIPLGWSDQTETGFLLFQVRLPDQPETAP
ncbi:MAG: hypothetical protein Alpg2KO_20690 [Alphaproteobacteria bacterium]